MARRVIFPTMPAEAIQAPVRLKLDGDALVANYRALAKASEKAATGAAVKADGYGLGAREVVKKLSAAGCRDFFVAHWSEAAAIADLVPPGNIAVLNGILPDDMPAALSLGARPVLNSPEQIKRWKSAAKGRSCHVMIDSGINRLGIGPEQIDADLFEGLNIDILASHLASADKDVPQNDEQLREFAGIAATIKAKRRSLANSAGIMLRDAYHFDLTRPGLALYGGVPRAEMQSMIKQVAFPQAQVLQVRTVPAGSPVGYNATHICKSETRVATIALGYADGYLCAFSGKGGASFAGKSLPVIGRVSMDMVTLDVAAAAGLREGDWVGLEYRLADAAKQSGLSQYELLTGLGDRFLRLWI